MKQNKSTNDLRKGSTAEVHQPKPGRCVRNSNNSALIKVMGEVKTDTQIPNNKKG